MSKIGSQNKGQNYKNQHKYMKKQTATNYLNEKFTIYAQMSMHQHATSKNSSMKKTNINKISDNELYRLDYQQKSIELPVSNEKAADSHKISKLKNTLKNLFNEEPNSEYKASSNNISIQNSNVTYSNTMDENHRKNRYQNSNINRIHGLNSSSIRQSRFEEVDEQDQVNYSEIFQLSHPHQNSIQQNASYNTKLETLRRNLQMISKRQYNFDYEKSKLEQQSLRPSGKSMNMVPTSKSQKFIESYSYALPAKRKYNWQIEEKQQEDRNYFRGQNDERTLSVFDQHKTNSITKSPQFRQSTQPLKKKRNFHEQKGHNLSQQLSKETHNEKKSKDLSFRKDISYSQTQKIKQQFGSSPISQLQQYSATDRYPQKILAPKIIVQPKGKKSNPSLIGQKKQMASSHQMRSTSISQQRLNEKSMKKGVKAAERPPKSSMPNTSKSYDPIYHKIEGKTQKNNSSIQYFNQKKSYHPNKKQQRSRQAQAINLSVLSAVENLHRSTINEIIPLHSGYDNIVYYSCSNDYNLSRVQFARNLSEQNGAHPIISYPYRHRGAITDILIEKYKYILSGGKDLSLKLGIINENQRNTEERCSLYQSYRLPSTPIKLSRIQQDLFGVATVKKFIIYDANQNKVSREINYPSYYNQPQNYNHLTLLQNQLNIFLGSGSELLLIDPRCENPYQQISQNKSNQKVEKWLMNKNSHDTYGIIRRENSKQQIEIMNFSNQVIVSTYLQGIGESRIIDYSWIDKSLYLLGDTGEIMQLDVEYDSWNSGYKHLKKGKTHKFKRIQCPILQANKIRCDELGLICIGDKKGSFYIFQ